MSLTELFDAHAFEPAPRRSSLHRLHVEFNDLTGSSTCEAALLAALTSGQRVALVGSSGSGKTSVTEWVLGPMREGVAPIHVPWCRSRTRPSRRARRTSPVTWSDWSGVGSVTGCRRTPAAPRRLEPRSPVDPSASRWRRAGWGPRSSSARLLDLVPGRSGGAYAEWLKARNETFRAGIKVALRGLAW